MTAVLVLAWLTALAAVGLLAVVRVWHPARYLDLSACMAGWCTALTVLALVSRTSR